MTPPPPERFDGFRLADTPAKLAAWDLSVGLTLTAWGNVADDRTLQAWTGSDGGPAAPPGLDCSNWTADGGEGGVSKVDILDPTSFGGTHHFACTGYAHLYCFQQ